MTLDTGKSFSEALYLASVNPQYDKRSFIEFSKKSLQKIQVQNMLCTNIVLNVKTKTENNFCTQHVVSLYFSGNSMSNLLSYCGLTDARMRASEKDLPVLQ